MTQLSRLLTAVLLLAGPACAQTADMAALEKRITALEQKVKPDAPCPVVTDPVVYDTATMRRALTSVFDANPDFLSSHISRDLEFHGYFRSGAGINSKGGKQVTFKAPTALAKYRLGNEGDTYIETTFINRNWNPDPNGVIFKSQLRLAYATEENSSFDLTNTVALREAFAQLSNLTSSDPGMTVWAGQRFYRLPELDINDFWWQDMSGYGGGLENKNIGIGLLDVSYIADSGTDSTLYTENGRIAKNNLYIMLSDINGLDGKFTVWANGGYVNAGTVSTGTVPVSYPSMLGFNAGAMHYYTDTDNSNQLSLQYGYGACTSLTAAADLPPSRDAERAWRFRFTDMYFEQLSEQFSLEAVSLYQYTYSGLNRDVYGAPSAGNSHWASVGIRPLYAFSKHIGLELEPGLDYVKDDYSGVNGCLFKGTAALRIATGRGLFDRPEIRIFGTYAAWGRSLSGSAGLGDPAFSRATSGATFGIQCETWW